MQLTSDSTVSFLFDSSASMSLIQGKPFGELRAVDNTTRNLRDKKTRSVLARTVQAGGQQATQTLPLAIKAISFPSIPHDSEGLHILTTISCGREELHRERLLSLDMPGRMMIRCPRRRALALFLFSFFFFCHAMCGGES